MVKSRKKKRNKAIRAGLDRKVHDRRATDLGRNALAAQVEVDDPYERGAKITVMRNLRDDPLAAMHDAGQVDQCQFIAGRHLQRAWELSEVGSVKAIDPGKEAVNGGKLADPITEKHRRAIADLKRARNALGWEGYNLVRDVLNGDGTNSAMTIAKAADVRGLESTRGRLYLGRRFRECLDTLAEIFGYAAKSRAA